MDAELEIRGQAVLPHGVGDDGEVVVKLLLELREVADVVNALVEAAGELRRDRLQTDAFVRERREDHQQLRRRLRRVGFIHRDFGDQVVLRPSSAGDVAVDVSRGMCRGEVLRRHPARRPPRQSESPPPSLAGRTSRPVRGAAATNASTSDSAAGLPMKSATSIVKKSEQPRKRSTVFKLNMIGIHVPGTLPAERVTAACAAS